MIRQQKLSPIQISAIIAGTCGLISLFFLGRFAFDDLYISFRYAEHLASGEGLTWNVGRPPVEGYTNFLLVIVLAVIHLVGLDPLISIKLFNILLTIASAILIAKLAVTFFDEENSSVARMASVFSSAAFSLNPYVWQNALSGLETTLFAFLILFSLHWLLRAHHGDSSYMIGFAVCSLAVLARPDGILFGMIAAAVFVIASKKRSKAVVGALLGFVLPMVLYELWRLAYFGSPLPNTFYVKVSNAVNVFAGKAYLKRFYFAEVALVLMLLTGAWRLKRGPVFITAVLWIIGLSLFYLIPTPIQGFYFRFLFSVLALLTLVAVSSLVAFGSTLKENYRWAFIAVVLSAHLVINWREARGEEIEAVISEATAMYREMGEALGSIPGSDSISFAYQDAGVVPYYSKIKHYDLVGLNDAFISRERSTEHLLAYLKREKIDIMLLPAARPEANDSCWSIFRQGHGKMGQVGPAIIESDVLDDYQLIGRYLYIGYDILIYVRSSPMQARITEHLRSYRYRDLVLAGRIPCIE